MITNEYETIYILQPELQEADSTRLQEKFLGVIDARKGSLLVKEDWGRRKLSYGINKHNYGVYIYLNYAGASDLPLEVERNLRNEDSVLRFLTVQLDDNVDVETCRARAEERMRKRAEHRAAHPEDEFLDSDDVGEGVEVEQDAGDDD